ncbi:MAG: hypothetical protein NDJ92_04340 [Thermoanaerobaculia bacterium]|nr:hypothetical protein [Thermoanaerobaculia bacterium]
MSPNLSLIVAAWLLLCSAASAAERRVLIPIVVSNVSGAFGTVWSSRTWAHNDSPELAAAQFPRDCPIGCAPGDLITPYSTSFLDFPANVDATRPGRIVIGSESLRFTTQLIEKSGSSLSMNLPVIPELSFARRMMFVRIAAGDEARRLLRVYSMNPSGGPITIHVYRVQLLDPMLPHELVSATTRMLSPSTSEFEPSYLQLSGEELFAGTQPGDFVNVEVSAVDDGTLIWGFITATDNTNQHVNLILPSE